MKSPGVPNYRAWLLLIVAVWVVFAPSVMVAPPLADGTHTRAADRDESLHIYLYAHGNPVMGFDPSGHFTLVELQTVMADMMTLARMAQPTIRVIHYANSILDMVNMVTGFARLLETGGLQQWLGDVTADLFSRKAMNFTANEAAEAFVTNLAPNMPLAMTWAPSVMADLASGARFTGYSIFGPNIRGSNNSRAFPSGLKVGGQPVSFVLGGVGSGRLAGIGIQTEKGGKKINHLFYRMDIHAPHLGSDGNIRGGNSSELVAPWKDGPFHFHVMKYDSNK